MKGQIPEEAELLKHLRRWDFAQFRITAEVGVGAYAHVYKARHATLGTVALKVYRPQDLRQRADFDSRLFLREAVLLTQCTHSNIIRCHGVMDVPRGCPGLPNLIDIPAMANGTWAIVLEYCTGGTLGQFVSNKPRPASRGGPTHYSQAQALEWMCDVVGVLQYLQSHAHIIIHRDIKLDNILITRDGKGRRVAKVADFGLFQEVDREKSEHLRSRDNSTALGWDGASQRSGSGTLTTSRRGSGGDGGGTAAALCTVGRVGSKAKAVPPSPFMRTTAGGGGRYVVSASAAASANVAAAAAAAAAAPAGDGPDYDAAAGSNGEAPVAAPPSVWHKIPAELQRPLSGLARMSLEKARSRRISTPGVLAGQASGQLMGQASGQLSAQASGQLVGQASVSSLAPAASGAVAFPSPLESPQPSPRGCAENHEVAAAGLRRLIPQLPEGLRARRTSLDSGQRASLDVGRRGDRGGNGGGGGGGEARVTDVIIATGPAEAVDGLVGDTSPRQLPSSTSTPPPLSHLTSASAATPPVGSVGSGHSGACPTPLAHPLAPLPGDDLESAEPARARDGGGLPQDDPSRTGVPPPPQAGRGGGGTAPTISPTLDRVDGQDDDSGVLARLSATGHTFDSDWQYVYLLTGHKGSYMYMAPEVYKVDMYNEKVDTFSLGVVMYELFSRSLLFRTHIGANACPSVRRAVETLGRYEMMQATHYVKAVALGYRPQRLPELQDDDLWDLIQDCWDVDPCKRPSLMHILDQLGAAQLRETAKAGAGGWAAPSCACVVC